MKRIAISTGDPCGIGPEITAKALEFYKHARNTIYVVYGSAQVFEKYNHRFKIIASIDEAVDPADVYLLNIISETKFEPGEPSEQSGAYSLRILDKILVDIDSGKVQAIVTCPVSKHEIQKSNPDFIGHTEYLAQHSNVEDPVMSFWGDKFILTLLTTHVEITKLYEQLTSGKIKTKITTACNIINSVYAGMRYALLAVNPHAGENGAFGTIDSEMKIIIQDFKKKGIAIDGPFPADTFFAYHADDYDVVISPYHDQGLIPFKMLHKNSGVNVTLGLPYVRTSVDHGTAFDIAGKGTASEMSLISALNKAEMLTGYQTEVHPSSYQTFSDIYDKYMEHVDYDKWVKFVLGKFNKILKRSPKLVHELACGTCNVASLLVNKGIECHASDNSAGMLRIARKKRNHPELFLQDMTAPLPRTDYDLILLLFDSINYLESEFEVLKLFFNVYESLEDNGLFIFDISTVFNCTEHFDGFVNVEQHGDDLFVHMSDYFRDENVQENHLRIFRREFYGYELHEELHQQTIFPVETIMRLLGESGLQLHGIHSMTTARNLINNNPGQLDKTYSRLFFVVQKQD